MTEEILSETRKRVNAALLEDERTAKYAIETANADGVVTLTGKVPSQEIKEAAAEIATAQEGVVEVVNEIDVVSEEEEETVIVPPPPQH